MNDSGDGQAGRETERQLYNASLVEDSESPAARHGIADALAAAVARAIEFAADTISSEGLGPRGERVKAVVREATHLALSAYEGKLQAASLDGELKAAQIAREYAQARKANAEAAQIEEEMAQNRLERILTLLKVLGVEAKIVQRPDGRLALALGGDLAGPIPLYALEQEVLPPSTPKHEE